MALDYESLAKEAAGNWRKFQSFGWHNQPEDADRYAIFNLSNRDSRLREQSNHAAIAKQMKPYIDRGTAWEEEHSHFGYGYVNALVIKVLDSKGKPTKAFQAYCDIQASLENYPVLDDEDYSRREYEATLDNIRNEGQRILDHQPNGWEKEIYRWLSKNNPAAIENRDDQGGYPNHEEIMIAATALGYMLSSLPLDTLFDKLKEQFSKERIAQLLSTFSEENPGDLAEILADQLSEDIEPYLEELSDRIDHLKDEIGGLTDELHDHRAKEDALDDLIRTCTVLRDAPQGEPQRQARFGFLDTLREIEQGAYLF